MISWFKPPTLINQTNIWLENLFIIILHNFLCLFYLYVLVWDFYLICYLWFHLSPVFKVTVSNLSILRCSISPGIGGMKRKLHVFNPDNLSCPFCSPPGWRTGLRIWRWVYLWWTWLENLNALTAQFAWLSFVCLSCFLLMPNSESPTDLSTCCSFSHHQMAPRDICSHLGQLGRTFPTWARQRTFPLRFLLRLGALHMLPLVR